MLTGVTHAQAQPERPVAGAQRWQWHARETPSFVGWCAFAPNRRPCARWPPLDGMANRKPHQCKVRKHPCGASDAARLTPDARSAGRATVAMYIDRVDFNKVGPIMPLQIANPAVVEKVERLARITGLTKTSAVERAVDELLGSLEAPRAPLARITALLAQVDRIPDRLDAFDPIEWDGAGLPR